MRIASTRYLSTVVFAAVLLATTASRAQQVPPKLAANVPGPVPGTAMTKEYVQMIGRMAYVWGWPMVNQYNRRAAAAKIPGPGLNGGVIPIAPVGQNAMLTDYMKPDQNFIACPNQDVVYGGGAARAGQGAGGLSGAGFRRPFLGLCDCMTPAPTSLARSASRMAPSLASISWSDRIGTDEVPAGITCRGALPDGTGIRRPACLQGRHPRGHQGRPAGAQPDRVLSAEPVR